MMNIARAPLDIVTPPGDGLWALIVRCNGIRALAREEPSWEPFAVDSRGGGERQWTRNPSLRAPVDACGRLVEYDLGTSGRAASWMTIEK